MRTGKSCLSVPDSFHSPSFSFIHVVALEFHSVMYIHDIFLVGSSSTGHLSWLPILVIVTVLWQTREHGCIRHTDFNPGVELLYGGGSSVSSVLRNLILFFVFVLNYEYFGLSAQANQWWFFSPLQSCFSKSFSSHARLLSWLFLFPINPFLFGLFCFLKVISFPFVTVSFLKKVFEVAS